MPSAGWGKRRGWSYKLVAAIDDASMTTLAGYSRILRDQPQRGKIGAVAADVAGEQRQPVDGCMRANEKVRQDAGPRTTGFAILSKKPFPRESGLPGAWVLFRDRLKNASRYSMRSYRTASSAQTTSLINNGPSRLAVSSSAIDQSAPFGSSVTRSNKTLVSTSVTCRHASVP